MKNKESFKLPFANVLDHDPSAPLKIKECRLKVADEPSSDSLKVKNKMPYRQTHSGLFKDSCHLPRGTAPDPAGTLYESHLIYRSLK